jgi:hypothetical protein
LIKRHLIGTESCFYSVISSSQRRLRLQFIIRPRRILMRFWPEFAFHSVIACKALFGFHFQVLARATLIESGSAHFRWQGICSVRSLSMHFCRGKHHEKRVNICRTAQSIPVKSSSIALARKPTREKVFNFRPEKRFLINVSRSKRPTGWSSHS